VNWCFLVLLLLYAAELGATLVKHGQRKEGTYNFFTTLITAAVIISLVYMAIRLGF
jgi:hypothetical protein